MFVRPVVPFTKKMVDRFGWYFSSEDKLCWFWWKIRKFPEGRERNACIAMNLLIASVYNKNSIIFIKLLKTLWFNLKIDLINVSSHIIKFVQFQKSILLSSFLINLFIKSQNLINFKKWTHNYVFLAWWFWTNFKFCLSHLGFK